MTATYESVLTGSTSPGLFSWRGPASRDLVDEARRAGWHPLTLDTRAVTSVVDFYEEVATAWRLPDWFGRNLDALFDALADLTQSPTVLLWNGLGHLYDIDPVQTTAIVEVFRDAVGQAPVFAVVVYPEEGFIDFDGLL